MKHFFLILLLALSASAASGPRVTPSGGTAVLPVYSGSTNFVWITNYINITNIFTTNFTFSVTNTVYTNVTYFITNTYFNTIFVTNGVNFQTNTWAGHTNVVNLGIYDQNFTATTNCSITGFTNKNNTFFSEVLLSIKNAAVTDITVYVTNNVVDGNSVTFHTIATNTVGMFWFRYTPVGPRTNSVFRQL